MILKVSTQYKKDLKHCCHCRGIGLQSCAHPAAPHLGRHRHDTCGLQGPLHKGYVSDTEQLFCAIHHDREYDRHTNQGTYYDYNRQDAAMIFHG